MEKPKENLKMNKVFKSIAIACTLLFIGCSTAQFGAYKTYVESHEKETKDKVKVAMKMLELQIANINTNGGTSVVDLGDGNKVVVVGNNNSSQEIKETITMITGMLSDAHIPPDDPLYKAFVQTAKIAMPIGAIWATGKAVENIAGAVNNATTTIGSGNRDQSDNSDRSDRSDNRQIDRSTRENMGNDHSDNRTNYANGDEVVEVVEPSVVQKDVVEVRPEVVRPEVVKEEVQVVEPVIIDTDSN